jgi:hypothetical protein
MRTRPRPGPVKRAQLRLTGARDARAGLIADSPTPMHRSIASVAEVRKQLISQHLEQELLQPTKGRAELRADLDHVQDELAALPKPQSVSAAPATAVAESAVVIRANTRIATLRSTLVEQRRRLNIEMVGLEAAITWKKTAAERQQEAEARYGDVCAALYDAARARHASCRRRRMASPAAEPLGLPQFEEARS